MLKWIGWKQKSAICKTANDTVVTLLNYVRFKTKPDTNIVILAEIVRIVNPCKTKNNIL